MLHAADSLPIATAASADLLALLTLAAVLLVATLAATMLLVTVAGLRLGRRGDERPCGSSPAPTSDPWREAARRLLEPAAAARR